MKNKVITYKSLPPRLPWAYTMLFYLLLDKTEAPEWVWGSVGFFVGMWWISSIVELFNCDFTDPFNKEDNL